MTNFVDIYQDLPCRVSKIWRRLQQQEKQQGECDLSVTAMLMTAATGLAMPWESLKDEGVGNRENWNGHPSFLNEDQKHYQEVLKRCNDFSSKKISEISSLKSISFLHCPSMGGIRDAVEYGNRGKRYCLQTSIKCVAWFASSEMRWRITTSWRLATTSIRLKNWDFFLRIEFVQAVKVR